MFKLWCYRIRGNRKIIILYDYYDIEKENVVILKIYQFVGILIYDNIYSQLDYEFIK